jgi:hypothetical protein
MAEERAHPRHQLLGAEGLHHVVVGPHLQAHDAVGLVAARGEHHHRHVASALVAPDLRAQAQSVLARKLQVEDEEVESLLADALQGPGAVTQGGHGEALGAQVVDEELDDVGVVLDHQGLPHRRRSI